MRIHRAMFASALLLVAAVARADDPATTIQSFFRAYANGATLQSFWADDSPGRQGFERAARDAHRVNCLEVEGLRIDDLRVNDDSAAARVSIVVTKREHATAQVWKSRLSVYSVALVKQRGEWRIRDASLAAEKLADALIETADGDERRALLAGDPDLISSDLVRLLVRRAYTLGNTSKRLLDAQRAGDIAGEIAAEIGDIGGVALRLCVRSVVSRVEGRREEARAYGTEAVETARRAGDPDALARALIVLGRTYDYQPLGEVRPQLFLEAASLENRVEDLSIISRAYNGLQQDVWRTDDYLSLQRWISEELRLSTLAGDVTGLTMANINFAVLYEKLGDLGACVEFSQRAAENEPVKPSGLFTVARLVEARCRRVRGEREGVRERVLQTLGWTRELGQMWGPETHALVELAQHHFLAGEYEAAEQRILESLEILKMRSDPSEDQYILLARIQMARGRYADVLEATRKFRASDLSLGPSHSVISKTYDAKAHRALGDANAALADLEEAMAASEQFAERLFGDERQRAMGFRAAADPFVEAVDLNVELGRVDIALACAERGRGRVLLESVSGGLHRVGTSATAEEQETEQGLEKGLATINRELLLAEAHGTATAAMREQLARARIEYQAFRVTLYARHPHLKAQRGAIPVASVQRILEGLPEGGAFLEYVVGENRTHVFIVSGTAEKPLIRVRTLPIGREALEAKVTAYRTQLARRALSQRSTARALDEILLAPVDDVLRSTRIIGIVADGALWQVPFEALVDARGRYRIETHTIFYAPSISIFLEMQTARSRRERREQPTLLAVADPVVSDVVQRRLHEVYRATELTRLPEAKTEVEELRRIYGRDASAVYVGAAATETRVKAEIGGRDVVHFATHGILDDASPMYSRLVLAQAENAMGSDADGLLEAWELMDLDLQADLVVLSSCDSARGRYSAGEGMIGMTWAAFVAGARTTVASLWKVSSKSTSTLMVDFHRGLNEGAQGEVATAEALRRAKLRMLRSETKKHPFYWAAFVAIGDPR